MEHQQPQEIPKPVFTYEVFHKAWALFNIRLLRELMGEKRCLGTISARRDYTILYFFARARAYDS